MTGERIIAAFMDKLRAVDEELNARLVILKVDKFQSRVGSFLLGRLDAWHKAIGIVSDFKELQTEGLPELYRRLVAELKAAHEGCHERTSYSTPRFRCGQMAAWREINEVFLVEVERTMGDARRVLGMERMTGG